MTNVFEFNYDLDKTSAILSFVQNKKNKILNDYEFVAYFNATNDANKLVTRATSYNIFNFDDECQELNHLFEYVKNCYNSIIQQINLGYEPQYTIRPGILGWIMEDSPSDKLLTLSHGGNESWSLISARLILDGDGKIKYSNSSEEYVVDTVPGKMVFFNSNMNSETDDSQSKNIIALDFNVYFYKNGIGDQLILQNIRDF